MTSELEVIVKSDVVVIVIGTPIDYNLNPRIDDLFEFLSQAKPYFSDQLIILRSTVMPGTVDAIKKTLDPEDSLDIVFCPERVLQGKAIQEIKYLPQIIGAYDPDSYVRAADFFRTFISAETTHLTPVEAELGKLITNMARYVHFALANEFHIICETFGANACRVIDACNADYPRLNMPVPGPNVGGPCLHKDGWFLIDRIPFMDLISAAFKINEGMTMQIIQKLEKWQSPGKAVILGMTFKAGSDDTRNSLSFKIRRQLNFRGYETVCVEPNLAEYSSLEDLDGACAVILMSPHKEFANLPALIKKVNNPDCWFVDLWGFWTKMRHTSHNGYFQARDAI